MAAIQAEAKLHALDISSRVESVNAECRNSTIDFNIFRNERKLEAAAEPPPKRRKLGWIPAEDVAICDSITLIHLKTDFVSISAPHSTLHQHS